MSSTDKKKTDEATTSNWRKETSEETEEEAETTPTSNKDKDEDELRDEYVQEIKRRYKRVRDAARKEKKREAAKLVREASDAPMPELIKLRDQTEQLREEAEKRLNKPLRWIWHRIKTMKQENESGFEATIFMGMTSYLDRKADLPPYVTDRPEKRKADEPTGATPDAKRTSAEKEEPKKTFRCRIHVTAAGELDKDAWELVQASIWDVQDDPDKDWNILTIEGDTPGPKIIFLADVKKAENLHIWLTGLELGEEKTKVIATLHKGGKSYGYKAGSHGKKSEAGLFMFRLVLPFSVNHDMETVLKTFKRRNVIEGEVKFIGRDEEAEKRCRAYATKPSRIPILLGDGLTMKRMLDIARRAEEEKEEDLKRSCFKVTNAMVPARYNVGRICQYIKRWEDEKALLIKEAVQSMALK